MICPLKEFLPLPGISAKVHPLRARNRSSFSIANAFAKSRQASSKVHKPIPCTTKDSAFHFHQTTAGQYPRGDSDGSVVFIHVVGQESQDQHSTKNERKKKLPYK